MPNQTEELLQQKQEEIEQLKRELRDASRPSALFSTLKKSVKRGVKEFFNREKKVKSLGARVRQLEKELEAAKEENAQKEVILLVVSQGVSGDGKQEDAADSTEAGESLMGDIPQTAEEALKKYFAPCDVGAHIQSAQGKDEYTTRQGNAEGTEPGSGAKEDTGAAPNSQTPAQAQKESAKKMDVSSFSPAFTKSSGSKLPYKDRRRNVASQQGKNKKIQTRQSPVSHPDDKNKADKAVQGADPEKAAKQENIWTYKPDMSEISFGFAINEEFLPPPIAQPWSVFPEDEFDDDFL